MKRNNDSIRTFTLAVETIPTSHHVHWNKASVCIYTRCCYYSQPLRSFQSYHQLQSGADPCCGLMNEQVFASSQELMQSCDHSVPQLNLAANSTFQECSKNHKVYFVCYGSDASYPGKNSAKRIQNSDYTLIASALSKLSIALSGSPKFSCALARVIHA